MSKKSTPIEDLPPKGASSATDIFLAVGSALSYWEGAEDVLMGLYRFLCGPAEAKAFRDYVASARQTRRRFLRKAIEKHSARFSSPEIETISASLEALDGLLPIRNEIAHGHCSEQTGTVDDKIVMSGFYLLPSLNEGGWHERSVRYAHSAETIISFRESVRDHRWAIYQAQCAVMLREQQTRQAAGLPAGIVHMQPPP